jgi:hypothetical protein
MGIIDYISEIIRGIFIETIGFSMLWRLIEDSIAAGIWTAANPKQAFSKC